MMDKTIRVRSLLIGTFLTIASIIIPTFETFFSAWYGLPIGYAIHHFDSGVWSLNYTNFFVDLGFWIVMCYAIVWLATKGTKR